MLIELYINDLFNLFYPRICASCGSALAKQEQVICSVCEIRLPYTNFHFHASNPLIKKFWGRIELENIDSLLYFEQGSKTQELLHLLKYESREDIGSRLAEILYYKYQEQKLLLNYDAIITIPLHPDKEKRRGYNQCSSFAQKLSSLWQIPYHEKAIIRNKDTKTQTGKTRMDRWDNVASIFSLNEKENLNNNHFLLIDDVLTTGATIEACAQELMKLENCKLSVLTIACKV